MPKVYFNILYYLRKDRIKKGKAPIYMRIVVNSTRSQMSTGKKIAPERWNSDAQRVKGNKEDARMINEYLNRLTNDLTSLKDKLEAEDEVFKAKDLKERYLGKNEDAKYLIEAFQYHNEQLESEVGKRIKKVTLKKYERSLDKLKRFLNDHHNKKDIPLEELDYQFISEFDTYLKGTLDLDTNTAGKALQRLKTAVRMAVKYDWLDKDPFQGFKIRREKKPIIYLTESELKKIENAEMPNERLERVRDMFIFCCYTGLYYKNAASLTPDHLDSSNQWDFKYWIIKDREKTREGNPKPVLPKAEEIIDKYEDHPLCVNNNKILPAISTQKFNKYLNEVAAYSGVKKNLNAKLARKTFACTIAVQYGLNPIITQQIMDHAKLSTTMKYYAKADRSSIGWHAEKLYKQLKEE